MRLNVPIEQAMLSIYHYDITFAFANRMSYVNLFEKMDVTSR